MESYRGYRGEEVAGRLASLEDGCRLRCGDEEDQAIACLIVDVEAEFVRVVVAEAVVAAEGSSVVYWMKESRLGLHCRSSHIGEVKPGDVKGQRCGKSRGVQPFEVKDGESHRMVVG